MDIRNMKCAQCGRPLHKPYYTVEWEDYIVVVCSQRCEHKHTQSIRNKPRIIPIELHKEGVIRKKSGKKAQQTTGPLALQQTVVGIGQNIILI